MGNRIFCPCSIIALGIEWVEHGLVHEPPSERERQTVAQTRIAQAARNNALWCDTVCRAHGLPGEFHDSLWLNRHPVPRFYPNLVTLAPTSLEPIYDLIAAAPAGSIGIKDSFATLDLAPLGFQILFRAQWFWWTSSRPKPSDAVAGIRWATVQGPQELVAWEAAWNRTPDAQPGQQPSAIFPPSLLADHDIRFVAAYLDQQVVAGAIANRTGDVVGVSNLFVPEDNAPGFWAGCIATILDVFPGMPLVGYERGHDLAVAQHLGFEVLGPLQVWVRGSPSS